ncbi:MAG TPA: sigma-54-dependent transcriptional regulator [Candidatus Hypogeohydataceae bacterium YC41]
MTTPTILIADDEKGARYGMRKALEKDGYSLFEASCGLEALEFIKKQLPDLVFLDINMPEMNGLEVLEKIRGMECAPLVVVITAYGSEKIAVEAMKKGAYDYIAKPFDIEELRLIARNALEKLALKEENRRLRSQLKGLYTLEGLGEIVGQSPVMRELFTKIEKVAATEVTVLLQGESGSGKELVAREIHKRSQRVGKPLVVMNCAALPETLIESELFGHEKGAFTGATERRVGKFEMGDGGTLFLDEVGDMSPNTQAKLLRAIEEQRFERLGGEETLQVNVRVISATNKDLQTEIENGRFREDLYYRLKVVEIELPPLRQRKEDIPLLVQHFLKLFSTKHSTEVKGVSREAMRLLLTYDWPGNVRQLANTLESAVVLAEGGTINEEDLQVDLKGAELPIFSSITLDSSLTFKEAKRRAVESFEKEYILRGLKANKGNVTRTAEALGMHRQGLQQKLRELNLKRSTATLGEEGIEQESSNKQKKL